MNQKQQSLQQQFLKMLITVIILLLLVFSAGYSLFQSRRLDRELETRLKKASDMAVASLSTAIWQFNDDTVNGFVDSLFIDDKMVFIRVYRGSRIIKTRAHPRFQSRLFSDLHDSKRFVWRESQILFQNQTIGRIQMVMTREHLKQPIWWASLGNLTMVFFAAMVTIITPYIIFRKLIFTPLLALDEATKEIGKGHLNVMINVDSSNEIGSLAHAFEKMAENLRTITASRDTLNNEITDRRKTEESLQSSLQEKEVLLREIHHRVKNNLQIIQSLLSLQIDLKPDMRETRILEDSISRIRSISLIHETLYQSEHLSKLDIPAYFHELIRHLASVYASQLEHVEIDLLVDPLDLDLDTSIYCGLIVNELVTNCMKHAFREEDNGILEVRLSRKGSENIDLTVRDNGRGLSSAALNNDGSSLGMQIVRLLTEDQLGGELRIEADSGVSISVIFPVSER